jgi:hypothetical protein
MIFCAREYNTMNLSSLTDSELVSVNGVTLGSSLQTLVDNMGEQSELRDSSAGDQYRYALEGGEAGEVNFWVNKERNRVVMISILLK